MAPGRSSDDDGRPRLDPERQYKRPRYERSLAKLSDRGERQDPLRRSRRRVQVPAAEATVAETTVGGTGTTSVPPSRLTPNPDAYQGAGQDPSTFLTTYQLADELGVYPEQIQRWCKSWFGKLPPGRAHKGEGYRIPLEYRYVARCWRQLQERDAREAARNALVADPREWLVVVARKASTHYTAAEAMRRVETLARIAEQFQRPIHVAYVGPDRSKEG